MYSNFGALGLYQTTQFMAHTRVHNSLNKFNTLKSPASVQSHPPPKKICGESPASFDRVTSRWKMRVPCEAKLSRDDRPLLYRGLAISNTCSHAKNRNDPVLITWSKVAFPEVGFSAVAILEGGWLHCPVTCLRWPTVYQALRKTHGHTLPCGLVDLSLPAIK